jgi:uncharacterized membrane protein
MSGIWNEYKNEWIGLIIGSFLLSLYAAHAERLLTAQGDYLAEVIGELIGSFIGFWLMVFILSGLVFLCARIARKRLTTESRMLTFRVTWALMAAGVLLRPIIQP